MWLQIMQQAELLVVSNLGEGTLEIRKKKESM